MFITIDVNNYNIFKAISNITRFIRRLNELIITITRPRAREEVFLIFAYDNARTNDKIILKRFARVISSGELIDYIEREDVAANFTRLI